MPEHPYLRRILALLILCCAATAASAAKQIVPFSGVTGFAANAGTTVTGLRVAVVDDLGNPLAGERVYARGCGYYVHPEEDGTIFGPVAYVMSDVNGVVTLPPLTVYYANGTCQLGIDFAEPNSTGTGLILAGQLAGPIAAQVKWLTPKFQQTTYGGILSNLQVSVVDANGIGIAGQTVETLSPCGRFDGGGMWDRTQVATDSSGVATMPNWTANPIGGYGGCVVSVFLEVSQPVLEDYFQILFVEPAPPPVTTATGASPQGGTITLTMAASTPQCSLSRTSFIDPALISPPVAPAPQGIAAPHGLIDFATQNCAPGSAIRFDIDFPQPLPPTAQWWKYGPTMDDRTAHWYAIPSTVSGKRISFTIADGGLGDDDLMMNGSISDLGMLAIPGGLMQDLWWSGPGENGWGMSIVQHRDVLFANMFVYDASGAPTWYVMPSGSWNPTHDTYTGNLYLPKGSPFYAYDGTKFDIGASVGTATIHFIDANNASFDYIISGTTGHKNITRILFGPQSPPLDKPLGDLWWAGSAQNGWGLAVLQQSSTLFALWFTYDADGKPTWFVMPGGSWVMKDDYQGPIFKAVGPPWLGVTYDVSRHHLTTVGTFRFRVNGDGAIFDYMADGKSGSINLSRIPF